MNEAVDSSADEYYLGIDVGGTNVKAGVVDSLAQPLSKTSVPTEADHGPEVGITNIQQAAWQAVDLSGMSIDQITCVGLATPGTMDIPTGMLLDPPNLPGWKNIPIRQIIQDHLQKPTILQNDANAAAYGEFWGGTAKEVGSLLLWTLGTGVGAGIIIGDTIIEGAHSCGSECGHIIIEMNNGRLCDTGQTGTLEAYCSAKSLLRRCHEALDDGRESVIQAVRDAGEEITPILMGQAAAEGDLLCEELILETARILGVGTTSMIHAVNPAMVLIGGAMTFGRYDTKLGRRFLQEIKDEVDRRAFPTPTQRTIIEYASLGGDAGFIGAAGCARLDFHRKQV